MPTLPILFFHCIASTSLGGNPSMTVAFCPETIARTIESIPGIFSFTSRPSAVNCFGLPLQIECVVGDDPLLSRYFDPVRPIIIIRSYGKAGKKKKYYSKKDLGYSNKILSKPGKVLLPLITGDTVIGFIIITIIL